jgi:DtxR family transcriptional regulator, Mn-dependent transcriptional regulator
MRNTLTHAVEDYLKVIYDLTSSGEPASTNALAARLNITPSSVTWMIKRLADSDPPLVTYKKHRGVTLTSAGQKAALEIIRHHRLLEMFLYQTLGYAWDEVHAEADRLEHVISEKMVERIARALGNPSHDPHGEPIPGRDLSLPPRADARLSEARPGDHLVVERVDAADPLLLRHLSQIGLIPGVSMTVSSFSAYDGLLHLQVGAKAATLVLGPAITRQVYVRKKTAASG